ncbi:hypothetical protein IF2G_06449 [Cordyceps javanica]|nr:hypothetical protein IF2G_06449 [Cordyceps javanica]
MEKRREEEAEKEDKEEGGGGGGGERRARRRRKRKKSTSTRGCGIRRVDKQIIISMDGGGDGELQTGGSLGLKARTEGEQAQNGGAAKDPLH